MKHFIAIFILLLIMATSAAAASDSIKVKVETDHAFATIGDRINFRVSVTHDPSITVFGIDVQDVLGDFEIKEATDFSTKENNQIVKGKNYVITNYKLGEYVIRPSSIQYRNEKGESKELKTNSLYITIETVDKNKTQSEDIRGVKGIRKIKGSKWISFILAFLTLGGAGWWFFYVQRKKSLGKDQNEPALSAHDEAYQALSHLQHSDLIRRGQIKIYFFQMSEILRRYFERRYKIKALESTTYEVLKDLVKELPSENLKLVDQVLSFCDLAKFAKYEPAPVEILHQNNDAKLIIDKTMETVPEPILEPVKQ